jgi:hypothetical protein
MGTNKEIEKQRIIKLRLDKICQIQNVKCLRADVIREELITKLRHHQWAFARIAEKLS